MKKIIYSIVAALILSVILALVFPTRFLKGDARWTYQSKTACVDISFVGNPKKGRVKVEGTGMRITQPKWLSTSNFQGTAVEIPVSYRNKTCQMRLTPQAEEWGKDAVLIMELKGKDFQHRGKRRPAWVNFRNITLNGQHVAGEKVVQHSKPFVLRYPLHSSQKITLAFDVLKPLAVSDIAFVNFLVVFLAFMLPGLFWASLRRTADHALTFINRKDIVNVLRDGYLHIDPVYRRSFWIIFGVLCFAFGFHTICFMWGNHDWWLLDSTHRWNERAGEGRYMLFSVKALLSGGIYLPLIHDMITFFTLALNAVLLCKYWRLEKCVIYYVLCGLVLTAQPFTLSMMYFVHMTPEIFIGVTCALVALLLSEKVVSLGVSPMRKIVHSLIAIVLINFALAMYPVLLNTIAVAFVGKLLIQSFDWDGSRRQLKFYVRIFMISAVHVIFGIVLYKLVITFVFPTIRFYNTEMLSLAQVPERLGVLFKQCFHQLYEYDMPFLPQWILWVFLGLTVILILHTCSVGNIQQKIIRILLLFSSLFSTQTAMIIAQTHLIAGRVEVLGLVFFEVLVMVLIMTRFKQMHNLWVITGACVISSSIIRDLDCLRVWKLGFDAEKMLWNRVLARLEIQKDFNPDKKYEIVLVGDGIPLRPRYYTGLRGNSMNNEFFMLRGAYDFSHNPFSAPAFYYPTRFRGPFFSTAMARVQNHIKLGYDSRLKRLYQAGVLQKAGVWPRANGLIVWKDIILFVTDGKELEKYKKQFERELGRM